MCGWGRINTFFMRCCYFPHAELVLAHCWPWISASSGDCWDTQCARSCSRIALAAASLCLKSFSGTGPAHLAFLVEAYQRWCCFPPLSCSRLKLQPRAVLPTSLSLFLCGFLREIIFILLPDGWFTRAVENIHSLSEHIFGLKASLRWNKHLHFSFKQGY